MTCEGDAPPRVVPNIRIEESKWNELAEQFHQWSLSFTNADAVGMEANEKSMSEASRWARLGFVLNDEWRHIIGGIDGPQRIVGMNDGAKLTEAKHSIQFHTPQLVRWIVVKFLLVRITCQLMHLVIHQSSRLSIIARCLHSTSSEIASFTRKNTSEEREV
jgi:hypothetical protein